ncbi:MAG TPA: hypothetical protein PLU88_11615, partial [Armatimonadota bacterium]|nr:hypothetical protein [Armatimonadota bacterium]
MRYTFIILLVALLAGASWGATIQVPTDYPTIQQAITVASAGDTILVSPGTYYGSITIDKPLIVKSTGGPEVTILDGNHVGEHYYMVRINSNDVVLDGFTITNPIYNRTADAAGVVIGSLGRNSNIRITNCIIHDIGVPDRDPVSFGTFGINCGPVDGLEIDHCIIHGIHNGSPTQRAFGIFTWGNNESDTTANISIHDNLIYDISSPSERNAGIHTGFYGSNISIKNNTIIANNECEAGITISAYTLGPVEIVNNKITGGTVAGIRLQTPQPANVVLNTINDASTGILVENPIHSDSVVSFNNISGNSVGLKNLVEATVPAEKNWWGSAGGPGSAGSTIILGSVDTDPCLKTPSIHLAFGGNRLVNMQRFDGGWAWPLVNVTTNPRPTNTVGPIAMGLANAYEITGDSAMLSALEDASDFLLAKTDTFSPPDGYLAAELDKVFGENTYVTHLKNNFYGPLSAGTYKRNGDTTEYNTETFIQYLRDRRTGKNINLPAWDLGMGIVGAKLCGEDVSLWVNATKAEIEELNSNEDFYVLGLAGALYGLAFVGEEFDPTDGPFADANNLTDLANILVDFQQADGSFIRSIIKPNSSVQETAYAMLALNEFGCFGEEVGKAAAYLRSVQLSTGGWENGIDETGENNEYSAEALWALSLVNVLVLNVPVESLYVKPGETVDVELYQTNMADAAAGYQAFLSFDTGKLSIDTGNITHTPDPYGWLHYTKVTGGNIDLSAGIRMEYTDPGQDPQQPSSATAKLATLQFTAIGVAGATNTTTNVAFRPNYPPTRFTIDGYELPTLTYDSLTITIDGIDPAVTVTAPNGGEWFKGGDIFNITWDAADDYLADKPIRIEYDNGTGLVLIAANEENDGTYEWTVPTGVNINTAKIRVSATDKAGNIGFDESDSSFVIDNTAPVITEPVDISVP